MTSQPQLEQLRFLNTNTVRAIAREHGTPIYVVSVGEVQKQLDTITSVETQTKVVVRYAMKANNHPAVLALLRRQGVVLDVSSGYEAQQALDSGFDGESIMLNSQEPPHNLQHLVDSGVRFVATSLNQLKAYGKLYPGTTVAVRINPGVGSGHSKKVTTAGVAAAFGIWHEYIPQVLDIAKEFDLTINQMNTHIGCGTDPAEWMRVADINLELLKRFPDVKILNMGGGFKLGRMSTEHTVNMHDVLTQLDAKLTAWSTQEGRTMTHVEIEPGTYLAAHCTAIIAQVVDIVDTGDEGYTFLRINTGMNDILRPAMYAGQHPLIIVGATNDQETETAEYMVAGHCCESSDVFTIAPGDSHQLQPRFLTKATIGDYIVIEGAGAYVTTMSAAGYNGFPRTKQVVLEEL